MAPSVSLAIPYEPAPVRKSGDLQSEVQKIVNQKGPFRTVTEKSLLEEIQRPRTAGAQDEQHKAEADQPESIRDANEKLWQSRKEMHERIGYALNEALSILDAISLTASGHSVTAQATMSPALKQLIPVGAFRPKLTEPAELTTRAKKRLNDLSAISKSQSFQMASEKFENALHELQTEAKKQSQYWEEIASLRRTGWQVSRLPLDKRAIAVHLGAADSGLQFQSRGSARVQQDEGGAVFISSQVDARRPKLLFVQVFQGDLITGQFVSQRIVQDTQSQLHLDLLRAREALFVEELFTEASREARLIANNGVQGRSSSITFDVSDDCIVRIGYSHNPPAAPYGNRRDDELAAAVGNVLRLMLVSEYQHRHLLRSQTPPAPMSQNLRTPPESMILRPIINLLRHHKMTVPVLKLLDRYKMSLEMAGLHMSYTSEHGTDASTNSSNLRALKQILVTRMRIALPSGKSLSANIETFLSPPRFGTQFNIQEYTSDCGRRSLKHSSSIETMLQALGDILSRDVSSIVIEKLHGKAEFEVGEVYPIQLLLQKDETPLLSLAVSCENGNIAIASLKDGQHIARQVQWGGEVLEDHKGVQSLLSTIESWVVEV